VTRDKAWSASTSSAPPSPGVATMRQVLKDIQHEEIPIRAYGLAKLREMVLAKDPTALAHVDSIIIIFGSQLEDSDQFVYLRAVDGLAAIGDVRPALAVPELAGQYTKSGVETPTRLKIGQAMLLVARRCGQVLPVYAQHFVNAFLEGCGSKEADVRASSLSNLAEMVEVLSSGFQPFIQDMLDCTLAVLSPTEVPEVQRAAVLLCSRMIKTLGNDGVVGNQKQMQRLYTHLKIVVRNNTDELTRVHAMSALDDLGSIMMKFLFPKDNACQLHVSM